MPKSLGANNALDGMLVTCGLIPELNLGVSSCMLQL
jgi:hypothetical protein